MMSELIDSECQYEKNGNQYTGRITRVLVENEGLLSVSCPDLKYGDHIVREDDIELIQKSVEDDSEGSQPYHETINFPEYNFGTGDVVTYHSKMDDVDRESEIINIHPEGDGHRVWFETDDGHLDTCYLKDVKTDKTNDTGPVQQELF